LHQAALAGHIDVVKLLSDRGARMDVKDTVWQSTPLGWAEYQGRTDVAEYLRSRGTS
jgi:ankyrin repeat protein